MRGCVRRSSASEGGNDEAIQSATAASGLLGRKNHRRKRPAYAMNMRAAEAIVSSAPKPMKIFPIREVWSQVELSLLLLAAAGAAGCGAAGTSAEASFRFGGGAPSR